jgi:alpha-D-ribose 1-methylphosphonate 5-triphosphate synthase subunit PhnI
VHPNVAELRVGRVMVRIPHPFRKGETITLGSIVVTEVEVVASVQRSEGDETPAFSLGYGACFGHNEVKAISTAVLDRAMKSSSPHAPAEDHEFVLMHTDGIESSGFCSHFKLPHYVTFQADLDRLRSLKGAGE